MPSNSTTIELHDQEFEVEFWFEPYQPGSFDCPPVQQSVTILDVLKDGKQVPESTFEALEPDLERLILEHLEGKADFEREEKAIGSYESWREGMHGC